MINQQATLNTNKMRLYDTNQGATVEFAPDPLVKMYVCGITPYDATHLGHATTYITYDVLQRRLRDLGHETRCVRNITDVDDDILATAQRRGVHYLDLAFGETARFDDDMAALNVLPPWSAPRATGAIPDIRGVIEAILDHQMGYVVNGSVYFDTRAAGNFGSLGAMDRERMTKLGMQWREDPHDPQKHDPLDFLMWRPCALNEPSWESRWGPGRPGWHIECTALALRELGPSIDLYGGGIDLLYPHHECVRVQSEAVTRKPFVKHWLHQAMVYLNGRKMSKSTQNLVFVHELRAEFDPMAIRLALSAHHYRRPWNWNHHLLLDAAARLEKWRAAGNGDAALDEVRAHLDDDLDLPAALTVIDEAAAPGCGVSEAAELIGVAL